MVVTGTVWVILTAQMLSWDVSTRILAERVAFTDEATCEQAAHNIPNSRCVSVSLISPSL